MPAGTLTVTSATSVACGVASRLRQNGYRGGSPSGSCVFLTDCACLESTRDVVLGDPDLIVAVREVRGVDQLQVVGEFLADGESRAWVRFVGDERRLSLTSLSPVACCSPRPRVEPTRPAR